MARTTAPPPPTPTPVDDSLVSWQFAVAFIGAAVVGAALTVAVLPARLPGLQASLTGPDPTAYWYLTRTSGMVAYGLAWMSMAFGVLISNRLARLWPGGPTAFALHEYTSLLAVAFTVFHVGILLGNRYVPYSLLQVLIPFSNDAYRPLAIGLGQIGLYLLLPVTFTFYIRKGIGQRAWRAIHLLSYAVFGLALIHSVVGGTDSAAPWAQAYYWLTAGSLWLLTLYRVVWQIRRAALRVATPQAER